MKKLFTLWAAMLITCVASAQISTWDGTHEPWTHGTGTEADPFLIENAQQLAYLAYRVNNGLDANGTHISNHDYHYKMMVDVNLNGSQSFQWTPIGYWNSDTDYQCFGGHFDGNGHTISGLYINSSANRVGLWGFTDGTTLENLSVLCSTISTSIQNSDSYSRYAGGLIGYAVGSTLLRNCVVNNTGNINTSVSTSSGYVNIYSYSGGVIGFSTSGTISIINCNHYGNVIANSSKPSAPSGCYGYSYSGGIVAYSTNSVFFINCFNTGNITATSSDLSYSGGIICCGTNNIEAVNCYNSGIITSAKASGGIVGLVSNTMNISNSYNSGDIIANGGFNSISGGIIGRKGGSYQSVINSCYNIGEITAYYLGGIIGYSGASTTVNNSYFLNTCGGDNTFGGAPMEASVMQSSEFVDILNNGACAWEQDTQPNSNSGYPILTMIVISANTMDATNVTQSHATLHGTIQVENTSIISKGFEYKKTTDSNYQTITVSGSGDISHTISNLIPNTQYQYRTFCETNDACGMTYGEEKTFTTLQISVTTNNATDITQSHSTLNGNLNIGDAIISSQGFQYKKTTDSEYLTVTVSGSGDISATLSDLTPNTQYRFRMFCIPQECDPVYGQEKSFSTQSINVTTNNAIDITQSHVTLNGNLIVGDANISSQGFQYKRTTNSEYQTVSVSGSGDVSTTLSDLTPNTQYLFRIFCTPQGCDPVYGQEKTFNTQSISVTTNNATGITQTHATLNGNLNIGDAVISSQGFQYKKTTDSEYQTVSVSGSGEVSTTLSNLTPNTQYRFRAFCTPQGCDPVYGQEKTFNTLTINVNTYPASNLTESSVTLNGQIGVGDAIVTDKGFKYWPANEPQNITTVSVSTSGNISATINDLEQNTYQYRAFVESAGNLYQGEVQEFEISWLNNETVFVYDADMLLWVAEQCNNGASFEGKYIKLMNDIELPFNVPNNMVSIGSYPNHPFKGTFDGNGKLIYNLYIDQPNTPYQGFFGYTLNANLYNVGLINITASGRDYTGGMVAYAKNTHLRDCYVNGGTLFALSYCGGLVGYQEQGTNSIISGCYNTCSVSGNHYVGGLVGFSNYSTVRNSYVAGPVSGQGNAIGAIIGGANEVLMYYSYFSIEMTGQTNAIGENNFKDGEGLTNEQMRDPQFVATLNQNLVTPVWKADYASPINNGFPIITWQKPDITSISENNIVNNIVSIYPNPSNDIVTIHSDDPSVSLKIAEIYDVTGRKVMSETLCGQDQGLSIAKLHAGIYYVRIQTNNGGYSNLKLVVQ